MKYTRLNFYKDKVAINLLAKDIQNAKEVVDALDGNALVGVLSKNFPTVEACVQEVKEYLKQIPNVSVGLGAGDPKQWRMAAEVASLTNPGHVNETFTGAIFTEGLLTARNATETVTNCMMYPTGIPGKVEISTGPESDVHADGIVDVETAVCLMKDVGLTSIKFFNMHGLKHAEELKVLAETCVKFGIPLIEPTGGIDVDNVGEIVKICHDAGMERIMPHIYSSIIDKNTGLTVVDLAVKAYENIKNVIG